MPRRVSEVSPGNRGIEETVAIMRGLVRRPSPRTDRLALQIAQQAGGSPYARAAAVHTWLVQHVPYVADDPQIEELTEPELLLARLENGGHGAQDCDDSSMLAVALLLRLGVPADFVLASTRQDREWDHVYVQAKTEHGVIPMDGILGKPFGWSARERFTATAVRSV